jgi:hypothetical protein
MRVGFSMEENMATYKWAGPHEWLMEKAQTAAENTDVAELLDIINTLVLHIDADAIQDHFQNEMDRDGYFKDKGEAQ